jgi:hypothetical protein
MSISQSVEAKVARVESSKQRKYTLVRIVKVNGDIPTDILGLDAWIRTIPGYEQCVVLFQDGKAGWLFHGATPEEMKEFQPFDNLDVWSELLYHKN